jgi:hypothetical protein
MGYVTTALHWTFVVLNLVAAVTAARRDSAAGDAVLASRRPAGVRL